MPLICGFLNILYDATIGKEVCGKLILLCAH